MRDKVFVLMAMVALGACSDTHVDVKKCADLLVRKDELVGQQFRDLYGDDTAPGYDVFQAFSSLQEAFAAREARVREMYQLNTALPSRQEAVEIFCRNATADQMSALEDEVKSLEEGRDFHTTPNEWRELVRTKQVEPTTADPTRPVG